uniref:Protein N-terminal glutamine amidohydrolase n=1 Tax=Caenorhabditis japonica TaxID=281687 RepID=A0A8R1DRR2_CAEJA
MIPRADAAYQSCYCEENVYKLIESAKTRDGVYAVFISNDCQMVPLWCQKSAKDPSGFVVWDYHVIAIHKKRGGTKVYDLDSTLPWGVDFEIYWRNTMKESNHYEDNVQRKFRVIPADVYLNLLSSDRSHMKNISGEFIKPPPDWPIINSHIPSNLMTLIRMSETVDMTTVMDEKEMSDFFST